MTALRFFFVEPDTAAFVDKLVAATLLFWL